MAVKNAKRIVVKVGTSTLTYENGKPNLNRMGQICRVLTDLQNSGKEIVLVTSGAIGIGVGKLNMQKRPTETSVKQAVAAVGQCELMFMYDKFFGEYNQTVAQVLLTKNVTEAEQNRKNVQNTFSELLSLGVIPIVNANDTVDTAELEGRNFGDNDMLSAIVAQIICAEALIILTDIDGLFTSDPRKDKGAKMLDVVEGITEELEKIASGSGSNRGTGGMATKIKAAKLATESGIPCYIINGQHAEENLYSLASGKSVGTYFKERAAK